MRPIVSAKRFAASVAILLGAAAFGACDRDVPPADPGRTATRRSAVTAEPPSQVQDMTSPYRASDIGPAPGLPAKPMQQISRPSMLAASQHPAHFANKSLDKPAPKKEGPPPPVPAAVIAKQNEYLRQWNGLEPTVANLPDEDQRARRAALKRQVLGE